MHPVCCSLDPIAPAEQGAEYIPLQSPHYATRRQRLTLSSLGQPHGVALCTGAVYLQEDWGNLQSTLRCVYKGPLVAQRPHCKLSALQGLRHWKFVWGFLYKFFTNLGDFSQIIWMCMLTLRLRSHPFSKTILHEL